MLVTALEANADIPKTEVVTERLLHEERKLKDGADGADKAMAVNRESRRKGPRSHYFHAISRGIASSRSGEEEWRSRSK